MIPLPIISWAKDLEDGAKKQADTLSELPYLFNHIALMPDCHQGYGMPIGGVIAAKDVFIPNAVGVDIGCGMHLVNTKYPVSELSKKNLSDICSLILYTDVCLLLTQKCPSWRRSYVEAVTGSGTLKNLVIWRRSSRRDEGRRR